MRDPFELAKRVREVVGSGEKRKYYRFRPAPPNFSSPGEIKKLRERLKVIRPDFADFEEEELILYPFVEENLGRAGISYQT